MFFDMKKIGILAGLTLAMCLLCLNCVAKPPKDNPRSPFTEEQLAGNDTMARAEGYGRSGNMEMAARIARMEATKALAKKLFPDRNISDGVTVSNMMTVENLFFQEGKHDYVVWILLEAPYEQPE